MLSTLNEKIIHQRFINVLLSEVYKYLNGIFPELMYEVSYLHQNHYNLCSLKGVLSICHIMQRHF